MNGRKAIVSRATNSKRPIPPGAAGTELPMLEIEVTIRIANAIFIGVPYPSSRLKDSPIKKNSPASSSQIGADIRNKDKIILGLRRVVNPDRNESNIWSKCFEAGIRLVIVRDMDFAFEG